jgi:hypothetical protein
MMINIVKTNELYSISYTHENWEYHGSVNYESSGFIYLDLRIREKGEEGRLYGEVTYDVGQEKISSISFNNISKEKEEIFTKYVNQIIEEVLEYFNFI